ncbi:Glycine betaine transporter OpuD [Thalassovita mediterranea]|uniref:Glycine betaine transporter OpuD n=1 Tax=Thalassovita mediterranea TaxID=340021 RepID=A0A0P1GNK4_9RHOB|nr:Glycine betaine transporter OpuD [Thalassovita mediterranea]SIS28181.1 BCCT, betaine/carnitine/choline family transporter [Thalassovita mediterranea]
MASTLTMIITFGILLALALVAFCVVKWWNLRAVGVTPVPLFTFIAILFTSGLDVGLIMFPLGEFPTYADPANAADYGFTNPLAIEFGFWGFLIWGFYFLTSFYFCVVEPRVKFFDIPLVKLLNNIVIIGTCAFTASLFLVYLPFYIPEIGDGETVITTFYVIVFCVILAAAYSSTDLKFVRVLSVGSTLMFLGLIVFMFVYAGMGLGAMTSNLTELTTGYFGNIHKFITPINDYHEFYLFWWFAWSIMIGQFTARFVGGLRTQHLLLALLVVPSIPLAIWFSVLYYYHTAGIDTTGVLNIAMVIVGITFVINSLDSLIRLYSDNLSMTPDRLGRWGYIAGNVAVLFGLTLAFQSQWLQIQWIGAFVVGIYLACVFYILLKKRKDVMAIKASPEENILDFHKVEAVH